MRLYATYFIITKEPGKENINYKSFSVHEGAVKTGVLDWMPGTGAGTKKGCKNPITLSGKYTCNWAPFSLIDETNTGEFKTLTIQVK